MKALASATVQTPPEIAAYMVRTYAPCGATDPFKPLRILEPSAGEGALLFAFLKWSGPGHFLQAVESDAAKARKLEARGFPCVHADFLGMRASAWTPFDRVFMFPPQSSEGNATAYIDHVLRARTFLNPAGLLVSICRADFLEGGRHQKLLNFRRTVDRGGHTELLPEAPFRESFRGARMALVTLKRGDQ